MNKQIIKRWSKTYNDLFDKYLNNKGFHTFSSESEIPIEYYIYFEDQNNHLVFIDW